MKIAINNNRAAKLKIILKRLIKFFFYLVLFCVAVYLCLWGVAYWRLESYKIDMDEMMSLDEFEDMSQE